LLLAFASAGALAASPEEAYLAARDQYIAKQKRLEKAKADEKIIDSAHEKALADLEQRLRQIIGDLNVKDLPAQGKINLESLTDSSVGSGMLDGLVFATGDEGPRLVVTTESLLDSWLRTQAEWWKKKQKSPPDADSALRSDGFYTEAIGSDAAFTSSAELPIAKPGGVTFAYASLGGWAQDIGPFPPDRIIVALRKDGKVYLASEKPKAAITKIPACEEIWKQSERRAEKLYAGYTASRLKDQKLFDEYTRAQETGDADFHACFAERAPREAFFAAVKREARAFADRIAAQ
jgi:hypothetical protein